MSSNNQKAITQTVKIIGKAEHMLAKVPLKMTETKLDVLIRICKVEGIGLPDFIEESVGEMVRSMLESSNDVGY